MIVAARRARCAFTLIEVLVAIVLIAVIVGAAFGFFWNTLASRARLEAASTRALGIGALQGLIEQVVLSSEVGSSSEGAVFSISEGSLIVPCRVVRVGASGDAPFARRWTLRFEESARRVVASWDREPAAPLVDGVAAFLVRASDGRSWSEDFDAGASGKLPVAVEVGLWWDRPSNARDDEPSEAADIRTDRPADVLISVRVPDAHPDELDSADDRDVRDSGSAVSEPESSTPGDPSPAPASRPEKANPSKPASPKATSPAPEPKAPPKSTGRSRRNSKDAAPPANSNGGRP